MEQKEMREISDSWIENFAKRTAGINVAKKYLDATDKEIKEAFKLIKTQGFADEYANE